MSETVATWVVVLLSGILASIWILGGFLKDAIDRVASEIYLLRRKDDPPEPDDW